MVKAMKKQTRLKELRLERGLTQKELAEMMGTTFQQVYKLETGMRRLNQDWIEKLCAALSVSPSDLLGAEEKHGASDIKTTFNSEEVSVEDDFIPFFAAQVPFQGGEVLRTTEPDDFRPRPPFLTGVKDAYALEMSGDGMAQKYRPNTILYINPNILPKSGQSAVVVMPGGKILVAEYIARSPAGVTIRRYRPLIERTIRKSDVIALHTVVGTEES